MPSAAAQKGQHTEADLSEQGRETSQEDMPNVDDVVHATGRTHADAERQGCSITDVSSSPSGATEVALAVTRLAGCDE